MSAVGVELTAEDLGRVHLVGVGGVGMSGLARLLLTRGIPVSGSELKQWPSLASLRALGGTIHSRHESANLDGVDTVVYSSAIPVDNVELVEARSRGLRVLHRAEALAATMTGRTTIAVAGTHGKTTTASMIAMVLRDCGLDPSFVIGGEIAGNGAPGGLAGGGGAEVANAHHGSGAHFVVEADESDRTFLHYRPHLAVVTNIDADHLNNHGDLDGLTDAFAEFCALVAQDGLIVACADDAGMRRLAQRLAAVPTGAPVQTYGEAAGATLRVSELRSAPTSVRYLATLDGEPLGEITLPVPGRHLALNSAAAVLTALRLGLTFGQVASALAAFPGVRRRFEHKGSIDGVRVYDEYAYHPTSMDAAMRTLREVAGDGRLIVVFQPYRVYRTRDLLVELASALALADEAIVMEVFGPGEVRTASDGGAALTAAIDLPGQHKVFVAEWEGVAAEVCSRARAGDVVVTMGAPPISLLGDELLAALATRPAGRTTLRAASRDE